ncbi:oxygenase MpaB family protein [Gordonia sp. ABSL1-1]|uniref:oxygenase MpaB family protein n=1 Tax=Gordonia sp. ABSL1-1 TaxID=3053923 RepID=UPI002572C328|nr:oxygenase MpaB family protein [Gordonia sp. ABSL1-1]MDL9938806.1 oxygenase MpaB family protein [Gordonia sp. ABSL1-1]
MTVEAASHSTSVGETEVPDIPRRHMTAPRRGKRLGRPLKIAMRLRTPTQDEFDAIGRRLMRRDEPAAALVRAMRLPKDDPARVSKRQFATALEGTVPADAPPALREFFALVEGTPDWVDPQLCERGAQVYRRFGQNANDVLLQLSLIGGYRFGGPPDLLVETGGLTGNTAMRRLGETQTWGIAVGDPGGMLRDGAGWRLTVHVRLMHALVNDAFERNGRWDIAEWGLPINQADLAATLSLFSGTLLMGVRALGVPVSREESRALMHLWKYVGWLIGVDDDWLFDDERAQHQLSYAILLSQAEVSDAGPQLSRAIVDAQSQLHYRFATPIAARYTRLRLLSMLEGFLGPRSMRDLGLPQTLPWAFGLAWVRNTIAYRIVAPTRFGDRYLDLLAKRSRDRARYRHFGKDAPDIGRLSD